MALPANLTQVAVRWEPRDSATGAAATGTCTFTPKTIVNRLSVEINKALMTSAVREKFAANGSVPAGNTPEEFTALIKRELTKWAAVVRSANIKVE